MTVPAVSEPWTLSETGLRVLDPNLPIERFEDLCWTLGKIHAAVRFAIGDAILFGEALYGPAAYQALEALGLSEDARREYVRVSEKIPHSWRRKDLSWSHHRAVAALSKPGPDGQPVPDREAQKEWLKRASVEGLSHHALREKLRDGAVEPKPLSYCRCCGARL